METWDAISARRAVRSYIDRPLRPIHRPNRRPFDEVVHRERW
jgi:hypothetical protein